MQRRAPGDASAIPGERSEALEKIAPELDARALRDPIGSGQHLVATNETQYHAVCDEYDLL